ncbi:MAG: hypothetical protein Q7R92_02265 [bacterium]|nr:hypothetical protein [bacterium]
MAQKFGEFGLRKKFSLDKLSKVGGVYFKGNKNGVKAAGGNQRGTNLQSTLIKIAKGKMPYTVNRELQYKYGIAGSQEKKRKAIMELIKDHAKNEHAAKPVSEKKEKPSVPKYRQALDTDFKRYQYGGAKVGVAEASGRPGIGVARPKGSISADWADKGKIGLERLGIKKDAAISAGNTGQATISINKKG